MTIVWVDYDNDLETGEKHRTEPLEKRQFFRVFRGLKQHLKVQNYHK